MKNTPFNGFFGTRLPREVQMRRLQQVIREELTELQRDILIAYYFENRTLVQIAEERNVNKSTICRTLKRAEDKLRKNLQ